MDTPSIVEVVEARMRRAQQELDDAMLYWHGVFVWGSVEAYEKALVAVAASRAQDDG